MNQGELNKKDFDWYYEMMEASRDVLIFSLDTNLRYKKFNRAFADATREVYGTEVYEGMNLLDSIVSQEDRIKAEKNCLKALKGQEVITVETYGNLIKKYFETKYFPMKDKELRVVGLTVISLDVTDREYTSNKINELMRDLEAFSYSVSHDLQAPLRLIGRFAEILNNKYADQIDSEGKRMLNVIIDNTTQMSWLIKNLLNFSRLNKDNIQLQSVDLNELIENIISGLKSEFENQPFQLEVSSLPNVLADRTMLKIVFGNLINNAIKYSSKREISVVNIGSLDQEDQTVYYIEDNGVGFDMKFKDKIFEAFERLHSSDEFDGAGIGLAIVKRIVDKHRGQVWATSEIDKGSTFYVSIPKGLLDELKIET